MVLRDGRLRLWHAVAGIGGPGCPRERREGRRRGARRSYLLQAQNSGAQLLGLANAGPDFTNALKAANELGITKTMKPAVLLAFITDIRALGLETAQGLYLTTAWYWDLDDRSRASAKRFPDKVGREPTFIQAANYSATTTYLSAVKAAGSTDPDKVMDELRKTKINACSPRTGRSAPTA